MNEIRRREVLASGAGAGALLFLSGAYGPTASAAQTSAGTRPEHGQGHGHGHGHGQRPRIIVSTDIGGTDFDDFQSMVHLLLYADVLEIEGLISSPYGGGTKERILEIIDVYERDFPNLRTYSSHYPTPARLRALTKKGESEIAPPAGVRRPTEGSRWIIRRARAKDPRPLHVLVWGGIEDVAQALHDAPDILPRLRIHFIGGPNKLWSTDAYNYIETHHPKAWIIEDNATYRGFFTGGDQTGEWSNTTFVERHVIGHGALGDYFAKVNPAVKLGDTPTVTWFLHGTQNPVEPSWGGRYVPVWDGRKSVFDRLTTASDVVEVYGIVEFALPRPPGYGPGNTASMVIGGRTNGPFPPGVLERGAVRFRWALRDPKVWDYVIRSDHAALDGLTGAVTAAPPPASRVTTRSSVHPHWWTDDQDPAFAEGLWVGAKHVSQWRRDYLEDLAERLDRCVAPRRPGGPAGDLGTSDARQ